MENFTPVPALAGGLLIGVAITLLLALNGRIAGISGIIGGLLQKPSSDTAWRIAFLVGLISGPLLYAAVFAIPVISFPTPLPLLLLGGVIVGFGTRLGSGCTSGHGICGVSRFSPRSILATCLFVSIGIVTVTLLRVVGVLS